METEPFFIVGAGRSGTTLMRAMLMAGGEVNIPPESYTLPIAIARCHNNLAWEKTVNTAIEVISTHPEFDKVWQLDVEPIREKAMKLGGGTVADVIEVIYAAWGDKNVPGWSRWGDKTPLNTLFLPWLKTAFPNAKYINMIRDGRDVVTSYNKYWYTIPQACKRWNDSIECAEQFDGDMINVRFEDMLLKPKETLEGVCNYLNLSYSDDMVERKGLDLHDVNAYPHLSETFKPIDTSKIGTWKKELKQKPYVMKHIGENLRRLGYD